jgi:hypothetical protein
MTRRELTQAVVSAMKRRNVNSRKTSCLRGHEFTPDNTMIRISGRRACRACIAFRDQRRTRDHAADYARRKALGYKKPAALLNEKEKP